MKQAVTFVINKKLDTRNHIIARNDRFTKLSKASIAKQAKVIEKEIAWYYLPQRRRFLSSLAADINSEWRRIEKDVVRRLEAIHSRPFTFQGIKGVLSSAGRFGYSLDSKWFAVSMLGNKYKARDTAMHELMHFMFHAYYWDFCEKQGLDEKQIWDIKESFTILLNLEFDNLRFDEDLGKGGHKSLRTVIKKEWLKSHDFEKTLSAAIKFTR